MTDEEKRQRVNVARDLFSHFEPDGPRYVTDVITGDDETWVPFYGNLSGNELARNPSGNTQLQSSQLAEPLWTDPGLESGISVGKLISTLVIFFFKHRRGVNGRTFSQNPRKRGKSHHHHYHSAASSANAGTKHGWDQTTGTKPARPDFRAG